MDNLTQHLGVVGSEAAGVQLRPGWHIVVFKQDGSSRTFVDHLQPGQKLNRGFLGQFLATSSYISTPVSGNGSFRHEFTSSVSHISPGRTYVSDYRLGFHVASHPIVATRWSEDPVRKLETEIRRVLDSVTCGIPWDELRDEILRDAGVSFFLDSVMRAGEDLQPYANEFGLRIDWIRMSLRLSKTEAQPYEKEVELDRSKRTVHSDKELKKLESGAGHEVKVQEAYQEAELEKIKAWGKLAARTAEHFDAAMGSVAANTKTGMELGHNVQIIQSLASAPGGTAMPGSPSLKPGATVLLAGPADNKLVTAITQLAAIVDSLNGDWARKRELASALVHLIAEGWREEPAAEVFERYAAAAKDLMEEWTLTSAQYALLNKFADLRVVRDSLK